MMPLAASYSLAEIEEKPSGTRPRQCTISTELGWLGEGIPSFQKKFETA
jgi:hypothetical protein